MKAETDEVALQGIEFWSNVCDEEVSPGIIIKMFTIPVIQQLIRSLKVETLNCLSL